jgi:prevent-host-death family protein
MPRRSQTLKSKATHRTHRDKATASKRAATWQLQAARANLGEVVTAAAKTPQRITRNGKPVAVVLSQEEYNRLTKPRLSLIEFFQQSPWAEITAEEEALFERDRQPIRDIDL